MYEMKGDVGCGVAHEFGVTNKENISSVPLLKQSMYTILLACLPLSHKSTIFIFSALLTVKCSTFTVDYQKS